MIYLGSDHGGFQLKQKIISHLNKKGLACEDVGNLKLDLDDDYPDFGLIVARKVVKSPENRGIVLCRSGVGVCIIANKVAGVRGFIPISAKHAQMSRRHDKTNVICFGADYVKSRHAIKMLDTWLATKFEPAARHRRRIKKISELEKRSSK